MGSLTRCAFCRLDLGNSSRVRRRLRTNKSGMVFCSHACRVLYNDELKARKPENPTPQQ